MTDNYEVYMDDELEAAGRRANHFEKESIEVKQLLKNADRCLSQARELLREARKIIADECVTINSPAALWMAKATDLLGD